MRIAKVLIGSLFTVIATAGGCGGSSEEVGKDNPGSGGSAGDGGIVAGSGGTASGGTSSGGTASGGTASGGTASGGTSSGGTSSGGTAGTAGDAGGCVVTQCQSHVYACGDCVDNDGDGKTDMNDPDCLGPCHNAENTYYGSIPGQAGPACLVDCYFDQDSGSGNDDCHWNHQCDPLSKSPSYPPEGNAACAYDPNANTPGANGAPCKANDAGTGLYETQTATCHTECGPLTPNGCDCFGCCELPAGGGKYVWLGSEKDGLGTCTAQNVNEPSKCQPCTPVQGCLNKCERCELCLGKDTLPADCAPKPPDGGTAGTGGAPPTCNQQCDTGHQPCGNGCGACAAGYFCLTGCCIPAPD